MLMRTISNSNFDALLRHLPTILSKIDTSRIDKKTHNAIRITKNILKQLNRQYNAERRNDTGKSCD